MRPHDLDVSFTPATPDARRARVARIQTARPLVKLEIQSDAGETMPAGTSPHRSDFPCPAEQALATASQTESAHERLGILAARTKYSEPQLFLVPPSRAARILFVCPFQSTPILTALASDGEWTDTE
jgi:hypothetical protein